MLTLRLPLDDRPRGLDERPGVFRHANGRCLAPGLDGMRGQLEIACRYGAIVERVAACHGVLPSIVAGFCSRRSGWGRELSPEGVDGSRDLEPRPLLVGRRDTALPPDGAGFLRGLTGLDYDRHPPARAALWRDPERNLEAAFALIADYRTTLRRRTTLQGAGLLRASLTAFECGLEAVQRALRQGRDVDSPSSDGRDPSRGCGRDVLARAGFFQAEGWD